MRVLGALVIAAALALPVHADPVRDAIEGYLDFATPVEGVIMAEQLTEDLLAQVLFIDTRSAEAFAQDSIDGAIHLEWRDVGARFEDIPETGLVVMYCDTAVLSSQAMFAARLMGRSNVLVLQGGLAAWRAR
jgi:rhodanese-related sulfurtransferase